MSFFKNIPNKHILLFIVLLAFILRVNNLTVGFPTLYISNDEAIYHQSALNMLAAKTPFILGNYGPLGSWLQIPFLLVAFGVLFLIGKVSSISDMEFLLATHEGYMLFVPRVISAMFGTLIVLVTFLLALELFRDRKVALWASFFSAVSFNLVHIAHLARAWTPGLFFELTAILFAIKSLGNKDRLQNRLIAYGAAAAAFGFHQITGLAIILVMAIVILGSGKLSAFLAKINLLGIGLWLVLILLFNYFSVGGNFFDLLGPANKSNLLRLPQNPNSFGDFISYYQAHINWSIIRDLFLTDGLLTVLAVVFFLKKQNRRMVTYAFLIFAVVNLMLALFLFYPILRYLLPAIAFLPVFAGYIVTKSDFAQIRRLIIVVVVIFVTFNSLYFNILLWRQTTFDQLRAWLGENIHPQVPIGVTTRRYFSFVPSREAAAPIQEFKPDYYKRLTNLIDDEYPANVRNMIDMSQFGSESKVENLRRAMAVYPVIFVVDSYFAASERLLGQNTNSNLELVAHFSPSGKIIHQERIPEPLFDAAYNFPLFRVKRVGPYFDVLRIK